MGTQGEAGLDPSCACPPAQHPPAHRRADSLGGEENKARVEEDQGEDDEERVAYALLVRVVKHLTGLGRAAERNGLRWVGRVGNEGSGQSLISR